MHSSTKTAYDESKDYIDIQNVRITPPKMDFQCAYEGKTFKTKLTIQNIGKSKAFIRITSPTSYAYTTKPLPRGKELPPGLSIERHVELKYTQMCVKKCSLPIYINENRYDLPLETFPSTAEIQVVPNVVDFGCVNAGLTSKVHSLIITNVGTKPTRFYIDIPRSLHEALIEPMKGFLKPKSSQKINIRLLAYREGAINSQFWIRSENPLPVAVRALIITAKFEAIHGNATSAFTLIDFPGTYCEATYTRNLYIRNYSALSSMFCVLGELHDGRLLSFNSCKNINDDFKYFNVIPCEGRFESRETKLFKIVFQPKEILLHNKRKSFHFAAIQIRKVEATDFNRSLKKGDLFSDENLSFVLAPNNSALSLQVDANATPEAPLFTSTSSFQSFDLTFKRPRQFVRVYLHGIIEEPFVTILPDELVLTELRVNTKVTRVLELHNNSSRLPIILHYKKVSYIELENNIFLKPTEKKEIDVSITHQALGVVNTHISFDLVYHDCPKTEDNFKVVGQVAIPVTLEAVAIMTQPKPVLNTGLSPNYIREVGKFCADGVRYAELSSPPKATMLSCADRTCNIALPNDRYHSLRPLRTAPQCQTIFTRKPRYVPPLDSNYELSLFDREFKQIVTNYYVNYTRREADKLRNLQRIPSGLEEYPLTDDCKILYNDFRIHLPTTHKVLMSHRDDYFIPLTPTEMNNISISPTIIESGKIASHHQYNFSITMTNTNNISLKILIKPDKHCIFFPNSDTLVISPYSARKIEMSYLSSGIGFYIVSIDVIINESTIMQVLLLADVVAHSLSLTSNTIFLEEGKQQEFIDIINNLNVNIPYYWSIPFDNFLVVPIEGVVKANTTLTCILYYYSHVSGPNIVDMEFRSGSHSIQYVRVESEVKSLYLELITKEVVFDDVPLNMMAIRKVLIRNHHTQALGFKVVCCDLPDTVRVVPTVGVVEREQLAEIRLMATFKHCIVFQTVLKFDVNKIGIIEIPVKGNVVYPTVEIFPDIILFKRVPFSSSDLTQFTMTNKSHALVTIKIDMSEYQDLIVSEFKHHWFPRLLDEVILEPDESKHLYLHYVPLECSITQIYLPIIINNILGPPIISDPITTKTDYYLKDIENIHAQRVPRPVTLNLVKVNGLAIEGKVIFSKLIIDFSKGIRPNRTYRTKYELKITNCQKEADDICIRTDDLNHPFYMHPLKGTFTEHQNSVVCSLGANKTCTLSIEFQPGNCGTYNSHLPVYLRSDKSLEYHNVIQLRGIYTPPTITGEKTANMSTEAMEHKPRNNKTPTGTQTFYSRPMPLKVIAISTKKYIFKDHSPNCQISTYTNQPGLKIERVKDTYTRLAPTDFELKFSFKFSADENSEFVSIVKIYCSCGGIWNANLVGCAENCFLTTYAFSETFLPTHLEAIDRYDARRTLSLDVQAKQSLMSTFDTLSRRDIGHFLDDEFQTMEFFSSYPFFPTEVSALTIFLESTLINVEVWLYNQVFFKTIRYKIPDTISYVPVPCPTRSKIKLDPLNAYMIPPYAQVLINMVGPQMITYLDLGPTPTTEKAICRYLYKIYDKALSFLQHLGAYFICLRPEYLLDYANFTVYKMCVESHNTTPSTLTVRNGSEYYYLAKQFWLDLLLQTYKVLYLFRLNEAIEQSSIAFNINNNPLDAFKRSIKDYSKYSNIYSNAELILINWLQFHYNSMKNQIWGDSVWLEDRLVNFFGENLQDGFVLGAVTAVYCPYLLPQLEMMYSEQDNFEELIHNNAVLTRCWDMLNCSFTMTAEEIIDSNSVQLLMFIAYLYEVLPSMYPSETIEMVVGLSKTCSKTIVLKNINDFPICYKVIFFSNDDDCFSTDNIFYVISQRKSVKIKVSYFAKFAKQQSATLLLSGEIPGYHYSHNKVVTLVGTPDITYMTTTITYPIYLYIVTDVSFSIKSPYETSATYNLQITYHQKETIEDLSLVPFMREVEALKLNRLMPNDVSCAFDCDGLYEFHGACTALVMQNKKIWLYFRNDIVGDFAICLVTEIKLPALKEELIVNIPKHISNIRVNSKKESDQINVEIPCQNKLLWNTIKECMLKLAEGDVYDFWKEKMDTVNGMQVLQQVVLRTETDWDAFDDICDRTTFRIIPEKNCGAKLPDTVVIENECVSSSVKVPIRFDSYSEFPRNFNITLESLNGAKKRFYALKFVPR